MGRKVSVVLLVIAVGLLSAPPAFAHGESGWFFESGHGRGRLDLESIEYVKDSHGSPLVILLRMQNRWGNRVLRGSSGNRLVVDLDVDRDKARDYKARIRAFGDELAVVIKGPGERFEPLPATRPSRRSVRIEIPGDTPPNPKHVPSMRPRSKFISSARCDPASGAKPCIDELDWVPPNYFPERNWGLSP